MKTTCGRQWLFVATALALSGVRATADDANFSEPLIQARFDQLIPTSYPTLRPSFERLIQTTLPLTDPGIARRSDHRKFGSSAGSTTIDCK